MKKKIFFFINPKSGAQTPLLNIIDCEMSKTDMDWDIGVVCRNNWSEILDRLNRSDADYLGICGGDGTVTGVLNGLKRADMPILILPTGTANILSCELKIPKNISEAIALVSRDTPPLRKIDVGTINGRCFTTRVGWGFESEMIKNTDPSLKKSAGTIAYALSAVKSFFRGEKTRFSLEMDGEKIDHNGFSLFVVNSGYTGISENPFFPSDAADGNLDIYLFEQNNLQSLLNANFFDLKTSDGVHHWKAGKIRVSCSPKMLVQYDGEILGKEAVEIGVKPQAATFFSLS